GSGLGVFARCYTAAGQPLGAEFLVNSTTSGDQSKPRVATDVAGDFIIVWQSNGVYAQRYKSDGQRKGGEFRVDTGGGAVGQRPDVAINALGGFVVVWEQFDGGFSRSVHARKFSA